MSNLDGYRSNLRQAQEDLEIAEAVKAEYKARGMIEWGRTKQGFEGWLVKGEKADEAFSNAALAKSNVEHWGCLVNAELRAAPRGNRVPLLEQQPPDRRLPPENDDEVSP